jgi:hypothetical protein
MQQNQGETVYFVTYQSPTLVAYFEGSFPAGMTTSLRRAMNRLIFPLITEFIHFTQNGNYVSRTSCGLPFVKAYHSFISQ